MYRAFVQFLTGDFSSIEIYNEDFLDKKVFNKERKNGVLVRGDGISMRQKVLGLDCYDELARQFREGIYDPIENKEYKTEGQCVSYFTDDQFEDSVELLTLIHEGEYEMTNQNNENNPEITYQNALEQYSKEIMNTPTKPAPAPAGERIEEAKACWRTTDKF